MSRYIISDFLSIFLTSALLVLVARFFLIYRPFFLSGSRGAGMAKISICSLLFVAILSASILTRKINVGLIPAVWVAAFFFFRGFATNWRRLVSYLSVITFAAISVDWLVKSVLLEPTQTEILTFQFRVHSFQFGVHYKKFFDFLYQFLYWLGASLLLEWDADAFNEI